MALLWSLHQDVVDTLLERGKTSQRISTTSRLCIVKTTNKLSWPRLIVYDENLMAYRKYYKNLNNLLKDTRSSKNIMRGITVLLEGATLLVTPRRTKKLKSNHEIWL